MSYVLPPGKVLCLKILPQSGIDELGQHWADSGIVTAADWIPTRTNKNGLFALLWGAGPVWEWSSSSKWLVLEVPGSAIISLVGRVKFPSCAVVYSGDQSGATSFIAGYAPTGTEIVGATITAGDGATAIVGFRGVAIAGDYGIARSHAVGTATAGAYGTAIAGNVGTATAGDNGTAQAGTSGVATVGAGGKASAGFLGTAIAGTNGTATAGAGGSATAGAGGIAKAGPIGVATAGVGGKASAGAGGAIRIQFWNGSSYELKAAAVGGPGQLTPDAFYKLDDEGEFVPA